MKKLLLILVTILSSNSNVFAGDSLKVILNGKHYSCNEDSGGGGSSGASCECKLQDGNTYIFLNGSLVTGWNGTGGDAMITCVKYAKTEGICDNLADLKNCQCKLQDGNTYIFLNGTLITGWNGTGGDAMKTCVSYMKKQDYCNK